MTLPVLANSAAACSSKVDFPIPGSPATKIALAGTKPPPKTRSNSSIPIVLRSKGASTVFKSPKASLRPLLAPSVFPLGLLQVVLLL